ncbi:MAG: hypothetical protein WBH30_04740, partial [Bacillota bacterium]
ILYCHAQVLSSHIQGISLTVLIIVACPKQKTVLREAASPKTAVPKASFAKTAFSRAAFRRIAFLQVAFVQTLFPHLSTCLIYVIRIPYFCFRG